MSIPLYVFSPLKMVILFMHYLWWLTLGYLLILCVVCVWEAWETMPFL